MLKIKKRQPGIFESLIPVFFLVGLLILSVDQFGDEVAVGPNQIALMLAAVFASGMAFLQGHDWETLQSAILRNINVSMQAILILIVIGGLIGTWILGGIVPAMVVWGLKLLSPGIFLFASAFIAALVSLATGSSWSTVGTVGLALIGIGQTMDIHMGLAAGAIVSGAYFGDKMSPLSETTNLAPAMAGTDLFTHIRHMMWTTIPSMTIALLLFLIIGFWQGSESYNAEKIITVTSAINTQFNTDWYILIPPVLVIVMVVKKIPALPALTIGVLMGIIWAGLFQQNAIADFTPDAGGFWSTFFQSSVKAAATGFSSSTGLTEVDSLLSRGGMFGMMWTIWLVLAAMTFGGVMEGSGMLHQIAKGILSFARSAGDLIASTVGTAITMNLTASDQYLSLVITGRMFKEAYDEKGLHAKNLSRTLEDSGTLTSPLVPWNTCGAFMSSTLGVATLTYLPFAFLNLLNPLIAIIYGYTGFTIEKKSDDEAKPVTP